MSADARLDVHEYLISYVNELPVTARDVCKKERSSFSSRVRFHITRMAFSSCRSCVTAIYFTQAWTFSRPRLCVVGSTCYPWSISRSPVGWLASRTSWHLSDEVSGTRLLLVARTGFGHFERNHGEVFTAIPPIFAAQTKHHSSFRNSLIHAQTMHRQWLLPFVQEYTLWGTVHLLLII